jgi:glycosyltransferase involved in cell wall biosynthesis
MLNVLFAADFPIAKSGIVSTASSILSEGVFGPTRIFSNVPVHINGESALPLSELGGSPVDIVFTHTEYSELPALVLNYPNAIFHVGDWPLRHWRSVRRTQRVKGTLAALRCLWRLRRLDKRARLAFVTQEDRLGAVDYGFTRALHVPIGVKKPTVPIKSQVDARSICFSGNFRYQPNRDAALRLLKIAKTHLAHYRIFLVGFYADDFKELTESNVEIYADVPSVVNFLAEHRPIYVSLVDSGAGAKNKILEAMVAGCPIICTAESLDSSIHLMPTISVVSRDEEVANQLRDWALSSRQNDLTLESSRLADMTSEHRSWHSVACLMLNGLQLRTT